MSLEPNTEVCGQPKYIYSNAMSLSKIIAVRFEIYLLIVRLYLPCAQIASYVKPPIAYKNSLTELGSIGTQKSRLSAVYVAVMPTLTSSFWVCIETWIGLLVAVKIRVRHCS